MVVDAARARARGLLAPIAGDAGPAGVDPRGDPRAQWLGDAMLVEPIVRREWSAIREASEALLGEVGKDLKVAAAWAAAAYELEGLAGLAAGLALVAGLLRERWEDMWPRRPRAREGALVGLYEHLASRLPAYEVGEDEVEVGEARAELEGCLALLDEVHGAAIERFAPPPMPRQARAELERILGGLPAQMEDVSSGMLFEAAESASKPAPPAPARPVAEAPASGASGQESAAPASDVRAPAPAPAPVAPRPVSEDRPRGASPALQPPDLRAVDLDDEAEVERFVGGLSQGMIKAAGALRRRRSSDPLAYRLLRVAIWLRAAEPPVREGRTGLAGIAANDRARYEAMLRNQRWAPLLDEVESALARPAARFHLDLQRYALAALEGLGEAHAEARRALLGELGGLLTRMPGLVELCDRDGVPLADEATRRLLDAEVLGALPLDAQAWAFATPPDAAAAAAAPLAAPAVAPPAGLVALPLAPPSKMSQETSSLERDDHLAAAEAAARAQLGAGAREAALATLQAAVDRLAGPRARFVGRAALARLCVDAGLAPVARAIFADLAREAETRGLAAWEPALVAPVLEGLLRAGEPAGDERARIFAELAALDPGAAARLALAATTTAPAPALDARGRR